VDEKLDFFLPVKTAHETLAWLQMVRGMQEIRNGKVWEASLMSMGEFYDVGHLFFNDLLKFYYCHELSSFIF
jgi:hypothetical protein